MTEEEERYEGCEVKIEQTYSFGFVNGRDIHIKLRCLQLGIKLWPPAIWWNAWLTFPVFRIFLLDVLYHFTNGFRITLLDWVEFNSFIMNLENILILCNFLNDFFVHFVIGLPNYYFWARTFHMCSHWWGSF